MKSAAPNLERQAPSWQSRVAALGSILVARVFMPSRISSLVQCVVPLYAGSLLKDSQGLAGGILLGAWCLLCLAVARAVGTRDPRVGVSIFLYSFLLGSLGFLVGRFGH